MCGGKIYGGGKPWRRRGREGGREGGLLKERKDLRREGKACGSVREKEKRSCRENP